MSEVSSMAACPELSKRHQWQKWFQSKMVSILFHSMSGISYKAKKGYHSEIYFMFDLFINKEQNSVCILKKNIKILLIFLLFNIFTFSFYTSICMQSKENAIVLVAKTIHCSITIHQS